MPTTTNYGWTTPADTDLVKDGASAIRTLGSSVDTTVKNLNPETTLGDIAYRSSTANVNTRLALGTAGQVLSVNSGATAPEWKTISSGLAFIQRSTFSNVAGTSTTFDGVFSSTYTSYLVVIENCSSATSTDDLQFLFRVSGADTSTADYWGNMLRNPYNAATWAFTTSNGNPEIGINTEQSSTNPFVAQFFVSNVGTSTRPAINGMGNQQSGKGLSIFYGYYDLGITATGFRLKSASTNISGTVAVYGLAK